jgi:transposase
VVALSNPPRSVKSRSAIVASSIIRPSVAPSAFGASGGFDGFVGVDVSKPVLDVHLSGVRASLGGGGGAEAAALRFTNDAGGIAALIARLGGLPASTPATGTAAATASAPAAACCAVRLVVLEATGGYEDALLAALLAAGVPVARANPLRVRRFAEGRGHFAKTDRIDARVLADYARLNGDRLHPAAMLSDNMRMLRELVARRRQLVEQCVANRNQLEHATLAAVRKSVQRTVTHLKEEVEAVEAEIQAIIDADPPLLARQAKLESVQGIGPRVARVIVSEFPELGRIGRAQAAALVGVAPFNDDSGTHTGARSIRGGRHTVRAAIYMATLVATRHNPVIRDHYQHLLGRGKPKKVALVACMRKMVNHLTTLLAEPAGDA